MEEEEANQKKNKGSIQIPSYQEVVAGVQPTPAASLSTPSPSFSEAFSFIKKTEFYKAPPPSEKLELRSAQREASISDSSSASASSTTSAFPSLSSVQSRNAIFVSHRQKGNPLLKHIRNVRWEFADVVCDYLLGQHSCALYLSLRYHLLHPDYLYFRIRELQKEFKLRVVLCHIDVEDVVKPLLEVTKTALLHDCTLLCGWSLEECGRYLETIKIYENKPADSIQERTDTDYLSRLTHALTTIRHVNKNDVITLGSTFGSLSGIMDASMEDLARCPGIGERKVKRLYDTFHEPFRRTIVQSSNNKIGPESPIENKKEPKTVEEEASMENNETKDETKQGQEPPTLNIRSALTVAFEKYSERVGQNKRKKKVSEGSQDGQAEK